MQVDGVTSDVASSPDNQTADGGNTSAAATITMEDITMLVDLFYLPFEHGRQAVDALADFHWLKMNAGTEPGADWKERANEFVCKLQTINRLIDRLCDIPNQALLFELFPYLWDIKGVLLLIMAFVQWLGMYIYM